MGLYLKFYSGPLWGTATSKLKLKLRESKRKVCSELMREHLEMVLAQKTWTNGFKWRMRQGGDDVAGRSTKLVLCNINLPVHNQSRPTWTPKPRQEQAPTLTFHPRNRGYTILMLHDDNNNNNNNIILTSLFSIVIIMWVQNISCIMDHCSAFSHISHRNKHLFTLSFTSRVNLEWSVGLTPKRLYCGRKLGSSRHREKMQTAQRKAPGPPED